MHKQLSPFITVSIVRGLQAEVVRQGSTFRSQPRGTRHSNLLRRCPKPSISKALGRDLAVAFAIPDRLISSVFTYFPPQTLLGCRKHLKCCNFLWPFFVVWRSRPTHTHKNTHALLFYSPPMTVTASFAFQRQLHGSALTLEKCPVKWITVPSECPKDGWPLAF